MIGPVLKPSELAEWTGGNWVGSLPERIEGISHDTRTLRRNNIFFALIGEQFDGHNFVGEAFEKGAAAGVVARSRLGSISARPLLCVNDTHKALIDCAKWYRKQLHTTVIGITGSVGKTTVKEMLAGVLDLLGTTTRAQKSWNNAIGVPLTVMNIVPECKFAVLEFGTNHHGEIRQLCEIANPDCGIITSIGPAHIGNFGSLEAIAKEKGVLLEYLPNDGMAVINIDNPFFEYFRSICRARIVTVSEEKSADLQLIGWDMAEGIATMLENTTGEKVSLKLSVFGRHNALNALHVVAMARVLGATWEQVSSAITGYKGVAGRLEKHEIEGICIINDTCNANPLSMRAGVEYILNERVNGKKWLVLGGMLELGDWEETEHKNLGKWIASKFIGKSNEIQMNRLGGLVVVGELGELIADGALAFGMPSERVFICRDVQYAVELLLERVERGDCILFKASRRISLEKAIGCFIKAKERA